MSKTKCIKVLTGLLIIVLLSSACESTSKMEATPTVYGSSTTTTLVSSRPITTPTDAIIDTIATITLTPTITLLPSTTIQETGEIEPFVVEAFLATNQNDLSTPLGTLCWAIWEWIRMEAILFTTRIAEQIPGAEVIYPANFDHNYTILDAIEQISKPEIVGIVNDPRLSQELQDYAKGFFADFKSMVEQTRTVGHANVDHTKFPYPDFNDLPHADAFDKAALAHPSECIDPSEVQSE